MRTWPTLLLAIAACRAPRATSADGASPDSASPDSASPDSASPDSASPDSASPDGASPDSRIADAMTIDGTPADAWPYDPVTVTIIGAHAGSPQTWGPFANVPVYIQDDPDAPANRIAMTDASGVAIADVLPGGVVSVSSPLDSREGNAGNAKDDIFYSWTRVQPGDHLLLEDTWYVATASVMFTVPADPGATQYAVGTSCGSGTITGTSGTITLMPDACGSRIDVRVLSEDSSGTIKSMFYALDQPYTGAPIDLSAQTYSPYAKATRHIHITGIDPMVENLGVDSRAIGPNGLSDGTDVIPELIPTSGTADYTVTVYYPLPVGLTVTGIGPTNAPPNQTPYGAVELFAHGASSDPVNVDLSAVMLPRLASTSYDAPTRTLTLTTMGAGAPIDTVQGGCVVARTTRPAAGWYVAGAYTGPDFVFPVFPTGDSTTIQCKADIHHYPGGYDGYRARAYSPGWEPTYRDADGDEAWY